MKSWVLVGILQEVTARQLKGVDGVAGATAGHRSRLSPLTATGLFLWASAGGLMLAASLPRVRRRVFGIRPKRTRHTR